jgi:MYXO-CTERM domain-containing protein
VVEHGDGSTSTRCVAFSSASLTGKQVLDASGIEYKTVVFGGLSAAVCQVEDEPATFPPSCWTGKSSFWAFFVARKGGTWFSSSLGISGQTFHDGDSEGFRYEPQDVPLPPGIMGNCPSPTPTPVATPRPTSRPTTTPAPTQPATARPTTPPPAGSTPPSQPAASSDGPAVSPVPPSPAASGAVAAIEATPGPSSPVVGSGNADASSGSAGDGTPGLVAAIVAIAGLAGLAALRRRPAKSGRAR